MPMQLRPEEQLLFLASREHLETEQIATIATLSRSVVADWAYVFRVALRHAVAPFVYRNLELAECIDCLDPAVCQHFAQVALRNRIRKGMTAERIARILKQLHQRSLQVMLVKGAAYDAVVYGDPSLTVLGDIDMVIRRPDRKVTEEELRAFRKGVDPLERLIEVEIEWATHHDVTMNGLLPVNFEEVWEHAREVTIGPHQAWVMCPEHMLIAACINACRRRYFHLKTLSDICETIRVSDIDWDLFCETAVNWRCGVITHAALSIAVMTMDCSVPQSAFAGLQVPSVRRWIVRVLSRRMSFCSLESIPVGQSIVDRNVGRSLALPFCTFTLPQQIRNVGIVLRLWRVNSRIEKQKRVASNAAE